MKSLKKLTKKSRRRLFKKALLVMLLVTTIVTIFTTTLSKVEAKEEVPESAGKDYLYKTSAEKDENGEITVKHTGFFPSTFKSAICIMGNCDALLTDEDGNPITSKSGQNVYIRDGGAIAQLGNMSQSMYDHPPASGIVYAQDQWNMITNGQKAYAQTDSDASDSWVYYPGLGFNILSPITKFWLMSRNIAYLAMILVIIVIAFLVAFRSSFSGQTQVTIANSIPNIILALVMITISYPLSGLAIDLITVGANLVQQVLVQNTFSPGYEVWTATDLNANLFGLETPDELGDLAKYEGDAKYHLQIDDSAMSTWQVFGTSGINVQDLPEDSDLTLIPDSGPIGDMINNLLSGTEGLTTTIVQLVFVISAFMTSLKLFFKLLTKYVVLIVYPIISPFIMLTIAIPGRGAASITSYFKTLLSASFSFIAVYAVFLFIIVLTRDAELSREITFTPPLVGVGSATANEQLGSLIQMILAFALFITTPAIPDMMDSWFNVINLNERKTFDLARGQAAAGYRPGIAGVSTLGGILTKQRTITGKSRKQ